VLNLATASANASPKVLESLPVPMIAGRLSRLANRHAEHTVRS